MSLCRVPYIHPLLLRPLDFEEMDKGPRMDLTLLTIVGGIIIPFFRMGEGGDPFLDPYVRLHVCIY